MAHNDKIKDCDAFFEVDPITRQIINKTPAKIVLMQGDHNSEKFTFTLPRQGRECKGTVALCKPNEAGFRRYV